MTTKTQLQLKELVIDLMKKDDSFLEACLLKLFEQQTIEERQIKNSMYRNAVGFNRPDAYQLSDYSIWKLNFPEISIHGELKTNLIKKLEKYALQLSSFKEIVDLLDGLKNPTVILTRIQNEIEVDKINSTTSLEEYLNYKKIEREAAQRERIKKKRQKEQQNKFRLNHDIIKGTIVEIEPQALKIKTIVEDLQVDLWFPKFSIINGYRQQLHVLQEFMIKKNILSYKLEEALGRR